MSVYGDTVQTEYGRREVKKMRDILFMGKRVDNGEWVYGNYAWIDYPCKQYFIFQNKPLEHEVIPETVGQYTGLADKNGMRIFEGDIVEFQFDKDDCSFSDKDTKKRIGRVYFEEFRASFAIAMGQNGSSVINNDLFKYVQNGNRVSIIGNIHDNPELLVGDEK